MLVILIISCIHPKEQTTMVPNGNQITALFEGSDQLGLSNRTRFYSLQVEGIVSVDDMA